MADQTHAVSAPPEELLGTPLLSCRLLPGWRVLRAQGYLLAWPMYYLAFPLLMLPYIAWMTAMMICFLLGFSLEEMLPHPLFLTLWVLFLAFCYWGTYFLPRGDELILHEKGIRVRRGFRKLAVPIESLAGIGLGRPVSSLEAGFRWALSFAEPAEMGWLNGIDGTALTFYFRDGRKKVFPTLLTRFAPEDLNRFFELLAHKYPDLVGRVEAG